MSATRLELRVRTFSIDLFLLTIDYLQNTTTMATKTAAKAGGEGGYEMRVLVRIDMSTGDAETMGSGVEKPCTEHEEKKPKRRYKALVWFFPPFFIFFLITYIFLGTN